MNWQVFWIAVIAVSVFVIALGQVIMALAIATSVK